MTRRMPLLSLCALFHSAFAYFFIHCFDLPEREIHAVWTESSFEFEDKMINTECLAVLVHNPAQIFVSLWKLFRFKAFL